MIRRIVTVVALIAVGVLSVGLLLTQRKYQTTQTLYTLTRASEDSLRAHYAAAVDAIVEIQDSLAAIMPSEAQVLHLSESIGDEQKIRRTRRDDIMQQIGDLRTGIQNGKAMIRRLEDRLKESETRIAGLEKLVDNLKRMVSAREEMVATLTARVESLQQEVTTLKADVAVRDQTIDEQHQAITARDRELSTIYYLTGKRKNLQQLGVVAASGGFLGLGQTSRLTGEIDPRFFTPFDTGRERVLRIPGKKPVVLTAQAQSSYTIVSSSPDWHELRIIDPEEFRKVRYLVVQVE